MSNGKTLTGLMIVLILTSFGYTKWSLSELQTLNKETVTTLTRALDKLDQRLSIIEGEQIRRAEYFKELLNLMNDLKKQQRRDR